MDNNRKKQCVDMKYFLEYVNVKNNIVYKLIHTERNRELLEDIPYIEFLDLSIVFQCLISKKESHLETLLIHNVHTKLWGVTVEELYRAAEENTQKLLPHELRNMADVMEEIMKEEDAEEFNHGDCMAELESTKPLYVLTNKKGIDGAVSMIYPGLLKDFADRIGSGFYIIPSSVHEVLLLPSENTEDRENLKDMVKEINDTQMEAEEILSYSMYWFDNIKGKICIL
ncbi:MAG TPA: hypothetical protein DEB74_11095 [Lachnospiraceae bacterium]|nr:hypothetical protein [Lachnospiraceae bacterium]